MKKIFLLGILVMLLTGCTSIENSSINSIIKDTLNSKVTTKNISRNGYSYYLPRGLSINNSTLFNEVLKDEKYTYYLYVDIVSYNNRTNFTYNINNNAYYSEFINYNDNKGYIEINNYKNEQYLIEIMYNYAKIEVVALEKDINKCVSYAMVILTSINYHDDIIKNYLISNSLKKEEENFNIFEIIGSDNYLEFKDVTESNEENKDPDYIN